MPTKFRSKVVTEPGRLLGRTPPHNLEAEAAVISSALSDAIACDAALALLPDHEMFYSSAHKEVWKSIKALRAASITVDVTTVASALKDRDMLAPIGGISFLSHLIDATPFVAHVEAHAAIVSEKHRIRNLIAACQMIAAEGYGDYGIGSEYMQRAAQTIADAADLGSATKLELAYDVAMRRQAELHEQWEGKRERRGLLTGFDGLDSLSGGLRFGSLSVLAALTGGGKSAAALQICLHVAGRQYNGETVGVVYVSLEMPSDEIIDRAVCMGSRIGDEALQTGSLNQDEMDRYVAAVNDVGQKPLWFYDAPVDVAAVRAITRRAQRNTKVRIGLVVVDYLGLMTRDDVERNDIAIGALTRGLKLMAMEMNLHVMVISQFSREAPRRNDGRPQLWDLKDSSAIEHDANLVMFVHRPYLALADKTTDSARALKDCAEFVVAKNRKGATGYVRVRFDGEYYSFSEPTESDVARWQEAIEKKRPARNMSVKRRAWQPWDGRGRDGAD